MNVVLHYQGANKVVVVCIQYKFYAYFFQKKETKEKIQFVNKIVGKCNKRTIKTISENKNIVWNSIMCEIRFTFSLWKTIQNWVVTNNSSASTAIISDQMSNRRNI